MTGDTSWFANTHGSAVSRREPRALSWSDRFRGALLGGAVGDALGAGVRTRSAWDIQHWFGKQGVADYLPVFGRRGGVTELTQLAVFTLEALLRARAVNGESADWLPTPVIRTNHLRWLYTQGVPWEYAMSGYLQTHPEPSGWLLETPQLFSTRNPAGGALSGLGKLATQPPAQTTYDSRFGSVVRPGFADCAVWAAPTMVWSTSEDRVFAAGADVARLLTDDLNVHGAAGFHADVLTQLIQGDIGLWDAVGLTDTRLSSLHSGVEGPAAVRRAVHAAMFATRDGRRPQPAELDAEFDTEHKPGELGTALASVAATGNFADAVVMAVNVSADSSVTGAMAGQLAGALYGPEAIPPRWREELELGDIIETLCADAAEAFAPPPPPPPLPKWAQRYVGDPRRGTAGPRELGSPEHVTTVDSGRGPEPVRSVDGSNDPTMIIDLGQIESHADSLEFGEPGAGEPAQSARPVEPEPEPTPEPERPAANAFTQTTDRTDLSLLAAHRPVDDADESRPMPDLGAGGFSLSTDRTDREELARLAKLVSLRPEEAGRIPAAEPEPRVEEAETPQDPPPAAQQPYEAPQDQQPYEAPAEQPHGEQPYERGRRWTPEDVPAADEQDDSDGVEFPDADSDTPRAEGPGTERIPVPNVADPDSRGSDFPPEAQEQPAQEQDAPEPEAPPHGSAEQEAPVHGAAEPEAPVADSRAAKAASGGHAKSETTDEVAPSLTERVLGCFLGGALGNALGSDLEFVTAEQITERFGPAGPQGLREAYGVQGAITDDTQLTLFSAEGLIRGGIARRTFATTDPLPEIQLAYQRWLHTQGVEWEAAAGAFRAVYPEPDGWLVEVPGLFSTRAPGKTIFRALARFGDGQAAGSLTEPINDSKGCGGVMRSAPMAMYSPDPPVAFELAARAAALTHSHPSGYLSAGALAVIVQQALLGQTLDDGVWLALQVLETWDGHEETSALLKQAVELAERGDPGPADIAETLGGGWVGEQALAIAVCGALAGGDDVAKALRIAVHHDGDSDSTGAICGNIVGALIGVSGLPVGWLADLELRDVVEQIALDCVAEFGDSLARNPDDPEPAASERPADEEWDERYPIRRLPVQDDRRGLSEAAGGRRDDQQDPGAQWDAGDQQVPGDRWDSGERQVPDGRPDPGDPPTALLPAVGSVEDPGVPEQPPEADSSAPRVQDTEPEPLAAFPAPKPSPRRIHSPQPAYDGES
ncbi:ADP-ribosylglycohydrolase family protein [Saccharopolyspora sp. NFXS83]|uniref:ADP-ribosylglycohydrolase family protein n=1 Tax=Saccharopolyspora sp. NFXS83 TaxID=2993560 RepID=UPI00224A5681|nr:ADP-ribosylglycohydrolase family protein [Saccharopolyspora sp. NFXS83]MCX2728994.1 ADP-ribosylglycohydrolase family protein [Saccharopolyspora sp. NFXS83]